MRLPAILLPLAEYRIAEHSIASIDITRKDEIADARGAFGG